MTKEKKRLKAWEKEKALIPVMIGKYCRGKHGTRGKETCEECRELAEYALFRLEKCPFKIDKKFCSFCKIHCYKPEMREKIKEVMKYSGPRMLFSRPVFAISHVLQTIKYKKSLKRRETEAAKDKTNRAFWNRFAFLYAPFMRKNGKMYADVYLICKPYLTADMRVLEIACGTGQFSGAIAKDVKTIEATDFSPEMVKRAKKKVKADNLTVTLQDAAALTYEDEVFDAVFIANALHIMPDPSKALREMRRVLKPGGILLAPTFVYDGEKNTAKIGLAKKVGFKTFNKWKSDEYRSFVAAQGFEIMKSENVVSDFLTENVLIAKKGVCQIND